MILDRSPPNPLACGGWYPDKPYRGLDQYGYDLLPAGHLYDGQSDHETGRGADETQHQVTLSHGFYLGKYEVTQAQYQTVMNGNPTV